jgi:predicted transcriptional regulator
MPDEQPSEFTAKIVAAYVRRNQVAPDQLETLIATVHLALSDLGMPATEPVVERTPAVSIRRSVHRDHVICLDCGWKGQMLRRHVTTAHGLTVEQYRARWNLLAGHAMTAPGYSERRSTMAKQLGLGRARRASVEAPEPVAPETSAAAQPRRRGRPRSAATPA